MGPTYLLKQLEHAGYEAYFVGGCVRDTLLGRPVHDWDITTSAAPEKIMEVFPHTVPTGLKHGTVTVVDGGENYEVTTFRADGAYRDGRHPDAVTFVGNLKEDLSRRDFTVNAMAMDKDGNLTDLFGGREDLQKHIVRCVGDAETRFREDALRMLRAFRFSAQLGFSVEENTLSAMKICANLTSVLSVERVRDEVEKTFCSPSPQILEQMANLGLLRPFGIAEACSLNGMETLPNDAVTRWTFLFSVYPDLRWEDWKLDKKTGLTAQKAAALRQEKRTELQWKALIAQEGEAVARCAAYLAGQGSAVEQILASGHCLYLKDLAVSGKDFPDLAGKALGAHLQNLLHYVHAHPKSNEREFLCKLKL